MNFQKKACFSRISRLKVTYMFMALTNSLVVLFIATADILRKLLQQCFLFFIVVVIPVHNLGNSQVSVNRTIGPTLVKYLGPKACQSTCSYLFWSRNI